MLKGALPPSLLRAAELDPIGLVELGEDVLGNGDVEL